ncbi:MAG: nucleotidyltransferase [Gammaproteobacteria bacterium]
MRSPLAKLFADLDTALSAVSSRWYVFDAQAAIIHGAARLTADVDITLLYAGDDHTDLLKILQDNAFSPRTTDPLTLIEQSRVLPVLHTPSGMPVDIVFGGPGLEEEFLQRADKVDIDGVQVPVASAEDTIVMKILAGRAKDIEDASAVVAAQANKLDMHRVRSVLGMLEKVLDRSDLLPVLDDILHRV